MTSVALVSARYEELFRFYTQRIGLVALVGNERSQFSILKGTHSNGYLTLYRQRPGLVPGFHHVGFEVWDEPGLEQSISSFHALGGTVVSDVSHDTRRSICIKDPDGLTLQFYVNRQWTPEKIAAIDADAALNVL